MSADHVIEIYISGEGRYVGANDRALAVLGYALDELVGLPFGALSATPPDAAAEVWRGFTSGAISIERGSQAQMICKDGRRITVRYLGIFRRPDGSYVTRSRLSTPGPAPLGGSWALAAILGEWRQAERALDGLAPDDPRRPEVEYLVERLRLRYQREARLRHAAERTRKVGTRVTST